MEDIIYRLGYNPPIQIDEEFAKWYTYLALKCSSRSFIGIKPKDDRTFTILTKKKNNNTDKKS